MDAVNSLAGAIRATISEASRLQLGGLHFARIDAARLLLFGLVALAAVAVLAALVVARRPDCRGVALPALLSWAVASRWSGLRHGALGLALAGLVCFAVALADPVTSLVNQEVAFPGRRISLMIDASSSMLSSLPSTQLAARSAPNDAAFFTTVGAARYFFELRMKGRYRDLVALVEFGDEAYVITPFTTDYENILLSMSLIGDWNEFMSFPDQGTIIARAIDQSVALFQAFDFLDASGNVMVIFTDGIDAEITEDGKNGFDVLRDAQRAKIPVYFIRVGSTRDALQAVPDEMWRNAVARTGGRFYPAADEQTIVRAMHEINSASEGQISLREYTTEQPRFSAFALASVACWVAALTLRLFTPYFTKFP